MGSRAGSWSGSQSQSAPGFADPRGAKNAFNATLGAFQRSGGQGQTWGDYFGQLGDPVTFSQPEVPSQIVSPQMQQEWENDMLGMNLAGAQNAQRGFMRGNPGMSARSPFVQEQQNAALQRAYGQSARDILQGRMQGAQLNAGQALAAGNYAREWDALRLQQQLGRFGAATGARGTDFNAQAALAGALARLAGPGQYATSLSQSGSSSVSD